ncbi:MAG: ABC transporter ATP-binding protein [Jatrophihabitantaceae bacterium]
MPRRTMNESILRVEHLGLRFGGVHAVRDCNFNVGAGTVVGLIGPNGAGKSTAIDLITGFRRPDTGRVLLDEQPITAKTPHAISRRGLMRTFQSPREWPSLTVMDNIILGLKAFRRETLPRAVFANGRQRRAEDRDRERIRALLDSFGLTPVKNLAAGQLSGGQKRLLEFARIAAANPRVLILDEPMGGVNPVLGERIGSAVKNLSADGATVIVVEHNLAFIEKVCDSVIVMDQGHVIASGSYASLRDNPQVVTAYLGADDA